MLCDPRLVSKAYGKRILESLPPMKRTRNLAEVEDSSLRQLVLDVKANDVVEALVRGEASDRGRFASKFLGQPSTIRMIV